MMEEEQQPSLDKVDSLLLQIAVRDRELTHKNNELDRQIAVYRAEIAERKAHIETTKKEIKKLEEEIVMKQNIVKHNMENTKSMKATHSMLLHYEQTLRAELESAKNNFSREMEVYEERLASYRKTFQEHKEFHQQNPLAQTLIGLLAEKEEMEGRIKSYSEQIAARQKQLSASGSSSSSGEPADSVCEEPPAAEAEPEWDPQPEEDFTAAIDISSLDLHRTKEAAVEENEETPKGNPEENPSQDGGQASPEDTGSQQNIWSNSQQLEEQSPPEEMLEEQESGEVEPAHLNLTPPQTDGSAGSKIVEEKQPVVVEAADEEMVLLVSPEDVPTPGDEEPPLPSSSSSEETFRQPSPLAAAPETPTFPFPFSAGGSLHRATSDTGSPLFSFSLGSEPSTPGFSGLVFDVGSPREEEASFTFPSAFFSDKRPTDSKSAGADFLFDESAPGEDFQFNFSSKSPPTTSKESSGEQFSFSFNF